MGPFRATRRLSALFCLSVLVAACDSSTGASRSPTSPSGPGPITLTPPVSVSPVGDQQLATLRPTLTVQNVTSTQGGTRTYEFQISDRSDFSAATESPLRGFLVVVSRTGVPEGSGGTTSFTPDQDLQPSTRLYWRARVVQGASSSAWSDPSTFRTKLVGFSRAGELYDPLIHGETIGTPVGSFTFVDGKGLRLNDQNSYVRYRLAQTITNGEFSVDVEGLYPNAAGQKLKIFSMLDGTGNLLDSRYLANVQYRGGDDANPNNGISFKALFGSDARKFEPNFAHRTVRLLDPSTTYLWKASWGSGEFRLVVKDADGGATAYDYGVPTSGTYAPSPHYAYLGANNRSFGSVEDGSRPGAVYRNVWIGNRPRPSSLGSALRPQ